MSPTTPAVSRPTLDDPLFPVASYLPLGRPLGAVVSDGSAPTAADRRPFGLRFATAPTSIPVDLTTVHYDADRQMSVNTTGVPVYGKHSTGQTSTKTSDGYKSMDSDIDHTED
ncbi:putative ATP-grasp-modified RiPP [Micromonospora sp. WMMA1363]|uniref:putative ATP-grasp-modified RiPP n=1 Tax=Micromonospora sp. WMMA1363 TaxID=3053985 RepID=UPI00259CB63B|nr:putative ATP-grasp-modified RiPP [Micromonospora sp. WMMA1363]MDM4719799.1 putative ATP-grasp-modified RiPP [Micromonospora sp. WMMA1363]